MDINCRGEGNAYQGNAYQSNADQGNIDKDNTEQSNATHNYKKPKYDCDTVCSEKHN